MRLCSRFLRGSGVSISRFASSLVLFVAAAAAGCASTRRASPPVFTRGPWRIRIDVDSAPSRRPAAQPIFGTIDFANARYSIDFWLAINRRLPNAAHLVPLTGDDSGHDVIKIVLGDSSSFDDKVVLLGRQVAQDSIVGTWSETIVCCSAAGRFSLWRPSPKP